MNTIHMRLLLSDFGDGINTHLMSENDGLLRTFSVGKLYHGRHNVLLTSGNSPDAHFISDERHGNLEFKR